MTEKRSEIRIPVPRLPQGLLGNLVGLLGLIAVAIAVGGLTGNWWWSLLLGGVFAVGLAYVASTHAEHADAAPMAAPGEAKPARPVAVARSA